MKIADISISQVTPDVAGAAHNDLGELLHACVQSGASIGFILPFAPKTALQFWQDQVFPNVRSGASVMFAAHSGKTVVGTVQLAVKMMPNQPHRADVAKLLVHPNHQRQGIARMLMTALEIHARQIGKTLLVLDTRSGDSAQALYTSLGFQVAGEIPGYCRNPLTNTYDATTYMFKPLTKAAAP